MMSDFLHFEILVEKKVKKNPPVRLKRKVSFRRDTISGFQELDKETTKLVIERRDGTVEEYVVNETYESVKEQLNPTIQSYFDTTGIPSEYMVNINDSSETYCDTTEDSQKD